MHAATDSANAICIILQKLHNLRPAERQANKLSVVCIQLTSIDLVTPVCAGKNIYCCCTVAATVAAVVVAVADVEIVAAAFVAAFIT